MTTLVCIDTKIGRLRRYSRVHGIVRCSGEARYDPWSSLPQHERVIDKPDVEAFRSPAPLISEIA